MRPTEQEWLEAARAADTRQRAWDAELAARGWMACWHYGIQHTEWRVAAWPMDAAGDGSDGRYVTAAAATRADVFTRLLAAIAQVERSGHIAQWMEDDDFAPAVPPGHRAAAERLLAALPPEWTRVEARPAYTYRKGSTGLAVPEAYAGVAFRFFRDGRYVELEVEDPCVFERQPRLWDNYLTKVRRAFAWAAERAAVRQEVGA